ncbi:T9SS type A sorting domain-containing protein [Labilibacter sediminis]|nr:T9SS type A sorting domain-containing protein [Labilibacter sediminis]
MTMKRALCIMVWSMLVGSVCAQTSLTPGDIAFVSINSDQHEDVFSFLLLADVESGTTIHFTDNGWTASDVFNQHYPESHFTWTTNSALEAGTVVNIYTFNGVENAISSEGVVVGDKMTVSVAGDQLLAYQGDKSSPQFIAAISFNHNIEGAPGSDFDEDSYSNSTTAMPAGLTLGVDAIHIYHTILLIEQDNARYDCSVLSGNKAALLNAINDVDNWLFDNDIPFDYSNDPCEFQVDVSTGLQDVENPDVAVYPNPAHSVIHIDIKPDCEGMIGLYSSDGVLVKGLQSQTGKEAYVFKVSDLPPGVYYVTVLLEEEKILKKVLVR